MILLRCFLAFLLLLCLPACTKTGQDTELARQDFDRICHSQKQFLEARQLKGVNEEELITERNSRMVDGIQSEAAMGAVTLLLSSTGAERREKVESAARNAGLKDWACPELGEGP